MSVCCSCSSKSKHYMGITLSCVIQSIRLSNFAFVVATCILWISSIHCTYKKQKQYWELIRRGRLFSFCADTSVHLLNTMTFYHQVHKPVWYCRPLLPTTRTRPHIQRVYRHPVLETTNTSNLRDGNAIRHSELFRREGAEMTINAHGCSNIGAIPAAGWTLNKGGQGHHTEERSAEQ